MTRRPRCVRCGAFGHGTESCRASRDAPLETPSANGRYLGDPGKVLVIPSHVSGADLKAWKERQG